MDTHPAQTPSVAATPPRLTPVRLADVITIRTAAESLAFFADAITAGGLTCSDPVRLRLALAALALADRCLRDSLASPRSHRRDQIGTATYDGDPS
jgi:hypothetical protein